MVKMGLTLGCFLLLATTTVHSAGLEETARQAAVQASINFAPQEFTLSVQIEGSEASVGRVTSEPAGIDCTTGNVCSMTVISGTEIVLTANPGPGSAFEYWQFCPSADGNTCTIQADSDLRVYARFTEIHPLTVTLTGDGSGRAWNNFVGAGPSEGEKLNCPGTCTVSYYHYINAQVEVTSNLRSAFVSFSGDCSGTDPRFCSVEMNQPRHVTVNFEVVVFNLQIDFAGSGTGSVQSTPSLINNCRPDSGDCSSYDDKGAVYTLTATPDTANEFVGWSGGTCSGAGTCQVTMNQDHVITATFRASNGLIYGDSFEG